MRPTAATRSCGARRRLPLWTPTAKNISTSSPGCGEQLGHCHPRCAGHPGPAATLIHCSNYYHIPSQIELANYCAVAPSLTGVLCNSGAEANEAAIKLARKYSAKPSPGTLRHHHRAESFHAGHATVWHANEGATLFDPLLHGFAHVPFNDRRRSRHGHSAYLCVMLEPIQGRGRQRPRSGLPPSGREICDRHGLL